MRLLFIDWYELLSRSKYELKDIRFKLGSLTAPTVWLLCWLWPCGWPPLVLGLSIKEDIASAEDVAYKNKTLDELNTVDLYQSDTSFSSDALITCMWRKGFDPNDITVYTHALKCSLNFGPRNTSERSSSYCSWIGRRIVDFTNPAKLGPPSSLPSQNAESLIDFDIMTRRRCLATASPTFVGSRLCSFSFPTSRPLNLHLHRVSLQLFSP